MRTRILVVEDGASPANGLAKLLLSMGFSVVTASDGLDAISKLRGEVCDVALIAERIRDVESTAIASAIRGFLAPGTRPSLIALTAAPERLAAREAEGPAMFDAIEGQPPSLPSLLATIRRCHDEAIARRGGVIADTPSVPIVEPPPPAEVPERPPVPTYSHAAVAGDPATRRRAQILLVDDDEQLCDILKSALEASDFAVDVVHNGNDALAMIETTTYDAVVLDYKMPEMSGLDAAQSILTKIRRANPSRLVAFTAAPERLIEQHKESATLFDDIINKADGIPALLAAVRQRVEYREWRSTWFESRAEMAK